MRALYITSLEPGAGKTAVALSLAALGAERGRKTGYFKPIALVESEGWSGDPDTTFYRQALGMEDAAPLAPRAEMAEALKGGLGPDLRSTITQRWAKVSAGKDTMLVEGLPCSGATAAASRDLAEVIDARVIAVVRFSRAFDLAQVTALRVTFGERLAGVVLNAVPQYSERVAREEATPKLKEAGVAVLAVVPEERLLLSFTVAEYAQRLGGRVLNNEERAGEIVESVLVGAMALDPGELYYQRKQNKALITRGDRPDLQFSVFETSVRCLILTQGTDPIPYVLDRAKEAEVPIVVAPKGTLDTVAQVEGFVARPTFHYRKKLERFTELLRGQVDWAALEV